MPAVRDALTKGNAVHLRLLHTLYRSRPVPFVYWSAVHRVVKRLVSVGDPLFSEPPSVHGGVLRDPRLQDLLRHDALGAWSLDPGTIDLVWSHVLTRQPRTILECGAGSSTLVLGKYLETAGVPGALAVSVEQDLPYKEEIERRLATSGLQHFVRVLHAPLSADHSYQLDPLTMKAQLGSRKADLLVIDGPSGRPGCRVWTLPLLAPFCRQGTRWFLDDAFRDGEVSVLRAWAATRGVSVEGIYPIGKGLATGVIEQPEGVTFEAVTRALGRAPSAARPA